jgi:hypothetical protein
MKFDTREEYNAYMRTYMLARYHRRRNAAIESLGGKCVSCGSTENLELDHIDPTSKRLEFGKLNGISQSRFEEELKKAQLLCEDCHSKKSVLDHGHKPASHGSIVMYKYHNCRCDPCRLAHNEYHKLYKRRRRALEKSSGS